MFDLESISNQGFMLLDILIAMILGGLIGWEREQQDKPAGLRTHILISGAACLFFFIGVYISESMSLDLDNKAMGIDPTRILHAIIVGISFIGAGTILKRKDEHVIKFLTTAATILVAAAIGIAVGLHLYLLAVGVTILTLVVSYLLPFVK